jgi:hypothetical protein
MSNPLQAIHVQVQLPDYDMQAFEQALSDLQEIAEKYPQLREGLALRAIRELWPRMPDIADDKVQMTLTLPPIVHALQSVGGSTMTNVESAPYEPLWEPPQGCKAKLVGGSLFCDACAFHFPDTAVFRGMK